MKTGIFGGTFNPIHYGHLRAAEEVREGLGLTKIIFIPSKNPPIKTLELLDPQHRYRMTELAMAGNVYFEISDVEFTRKGKSYSVQTIEELLGMHHGATLYFIIGIDAFLDIPNWWNPERLVSIVDFIVISRPSFRFVDLLSSPYIKTDRKELARLDEAELQMQTINMKSNRKVIAFSIPPIDISATEIRRLVREGKSIKYLLPESVESYIIANKLYAK